MFIGKPKYFSYVFNLFLATYTLDEDLKHTRSYFSYGAFFVGILLFIHALIYKPGSMVKRHHHARKKKEAEERKKAYEDNKEEQ
jgi:hypothetical protein